MGHKFIFQLFFSMGASKVPFRASKSLLDLLRNMKPLLPLRQKKSFCLFTSLFVPMQFSKGLPGHEQFPKSEVNALKILGLERT